MDGQQGLDGGIRPVRMAKNHSLMCFLFIPFCFFWTISYAVECLINFTQLNNLFILAFYLIGESTKHYFYFNIKNFNILTYLILFFLKIGVIL